MLKMELDYNNGTAPTVVFTSTFFLQYSVLNALRGNRLQLLIFFPNGTTLPKVKGRTNFHDGLIRRTVLKVQCIGIISCGKLNNRQIMERNCNKTMY